MLNHKALTELFSQNIDDRLCKQWALMTPNGTLLAYSLPTDIKELRRHAAVAALSWQKQQASQQDNPDDAGEDGEPEKIALPSLLRTLTIESEASNVIVRKIQPQLLLVLEGGVPPRRRTCQPCVIPEGPGDAPYPSHERPNAESMLASSAVSLAESSKSSAALGVLGLQRRKLDAMASALAQEFERTGFKMPDEGSTKFF